MEVLSLELADLLTPDGLAADLLYPRNLDGHDARDYLPGVEDRRRPLDQPPDDVGCGDAGIC